MRAKLVKSKNNKFNFILVEVNSQDLSNLVAELPLRVAFFLDKKSHLPWYERKTIIVKISNKPVEEDAKIYEDDKGLVFLDGDIDRNYLKDTVNTTKEKLVDLLSKQIGEILGGIKV